MSIYGLILGICFTIGITFFERRNKIIPKNKKNIFIIFLFILGIIGARAYSIIQNWSYFSQNPIQTLNFRGGGLGIIGTIIFGIIFIFIFSKQTKFLF
jgi:phosphatidylglycerol:prolipoprotein diacylglycerol transferase